MNGTLAGWPKGYGIMSHIIAGAILLASTTSVATTMETRISCAMVMARRHP
jgi:hypothetical protein